MSCAKNARKYSIFCEIYNQIVFCRTHLYVEFSEYPNAPFHMAQTKYIFKHKIGVKMFDT